MKERERERAWGSGNEVTPREDEIGKLMGVVGKKDKNDQRDG